MEPGAAPGSGEQTTLAQVGKTTLCYEEFGDPSDETLVLVMGLGMQMLAWDEEFCRQCVEAGFHVVRFDNRDVGLSSKVGGRRVNLYAGMIGLTGSAAYDVDDMAADTLGLLDHLGVDRAHLVGASMGGMISQQLAANNPDRVRSLCSIMSSTGKRKLSTTPRPEIARLLLRAPAASRSEFIEGSVSLFAKIGSPDFPADADRIRERAALSYDRCYYPAGTARQLMAVMASGDRTESLRSVEAPTLVIHGDSDRLVPPQAGRDTARAIPNSRLQMVEGMGHDLPPALWPSFVEMIRANAGRQSA